MDWTKLPCNFFIKSLPLSHSLSLHLSLLLSASTLGFTYHNRWRKPSFFCRGTLPLAYNEDAPCPLLCCGFYITIALTAPFLSYSHDLRLGAPLICPKLHGQKEDMKGPKDQRFAGSGLVSFNEDNLDILQTMRFACRIIFSRCQS